MITPRRLLTLLPPPEAWDNGKVERYVSSALTILSLLGNGFLNVPEVVPLSRVPNRPLPFRSKIDLLEFGKLLKSKGISLYLNRYFPLVPKGRTRSWLKEAKGVADGVVVVGKITSRYRYPGYTVEEAVRLATEYFRHVGVITIFEREGEVNRVCRKVKAGANFLVSQITFYPERVRQFSTAVDRRCKELNLPTPRLYVSLSPVFGTEDVELLRWMEVDVPRRIPPMGTLVRAMLEIPGVFGINYEHLRYSNLERLGEVLAGLDTV